MNWQYERATCPVSGELGKLISSDDFKDGRSSITQQHKSIDILKEIEPFSWIKKGNPLLNHFLEGCKPININKKNNEKKRKWMLLPTQLDKLCM